MRWPWQKEPAAPAAVAVPEPSRPAAVLLPALQALAVGAPTEPVETDEPVIVETTQDLADHERDAPKLTREGQQYLCELLGQYRTSGQIIMAMQAKFGVGLRKQALTWYKQSPKWKPVIESARLAYNKRLQEIPIANKVTRLERLEGLYNRAVATGNLDRAQRYLEAAQEETKEVKPETVYVHQNILNLSTDELVQRQRELLQRLQPKETLDALSET